MAELPNLCGLAAWREREEQTGACTAVLAHAHMHKQAACMHKLATRTRGGDGTVGTHVHVQGSR